MILGPREHMPGGDEAHLEVVHCGKRRTPPGPQHQQGIPGTLDCKGKAWQSIRMGAPQNRVTRNPLLQQGFSYWTLATHALCLLLIGHTQLCMPPCQITSWAAWAGHSKGRSVPSWPKFLGFAANLTSAHQVLHHRQHRGGLP